MMTELMLVEGVSDVQLISYYLQNVYGWKHEKDNRLGISPMDAHDHIESLSKDENQLVLCGVGGNRRFTHFVEMHRINNILVESDISSIMVVTDRDEDSISKIRRTVNNSFENVTFKDGEWNSNNIKDSIDALKDIPEEKELIQEVILFINSLKARLVPDLNQMNKANKATVGTFFSVRTPKQAMRSFAAFVATIDWSKSESLKELFGAFEQLGRKRDKYIGIGK